MKMNTASKRGKGGKGEEIPFPPFPLSRVRSLVSLPTCTLAAAAALALAGCKIPPINLSTSEPIKVDIDMRLDVYQHTDGEPKPAATPSESSPRNGTTAAERRKDREAEIQTFKNSRLVGERHDGLLEVLVEPAGEYGDTVRQTVARENADRMTDMKTEAEKQKISVDEIQKQQGELWANRSFSGEWIEIAQADKTWKWEQKK